MTRTIYRVSFDPRPIRVNTEAGDGGTSTKSVTFLHCEFDARPIRVHKEAETWIKKADFSFMHLILPREDWWWASIQLSWCWVRLVQC